MTVDEQLGRLAQAAERLEEGAQALDDALAQIDALLAQIVPGFTYVHPRPLDEQTRYGVDGKRVIEIAYVGYLPLEGRHRLAVKTIKVLERKAAIAWEAPGQAVALLAAPSALRYAAVDLLPEVVQGLASQVDDVAEAMERRRRSAGALLEQLRAVSQGANTTASATPPARRQTQPAFSRKG